MTSGTTFKLEVNPGLPRRLARLEELANNLLYSWDEETRLLFSRLDPSLWSEVDHNPKAFLKRIDEQKLIDAADDPVFLGNLNRVLSAFDDYLKEPLRRNGSEWLRKNDLIVYFCAEFGFHESLPIYSGGLGILAGDHCKSASDMRLPFVGVGLLYRQGYFHQTSARCTPTRTLMICPFPRCCATTDPTCGSALNYLVETCSSRYGRRTLAM
jgi:starch phosphorylase